MSHYFENNENLESEIRYFSYTYKTYLINFKSDRGVFAKDRLDFGTHILLSSLPEFTNEVILDMGAGVGTIGLCLAKAYPQTKVTLVDVNTRALNLSRENALTNKIKNVTIMESDLYTNVSGSFDCLVTNPPIRAGKRVVYKIFSDSLTYLNSGAKVYAVIQKKHGALSLMKEMNEIYGNVEIISKKKAYYVLMSENLK